MSTSEHDHGLAGERRDLSEGGCPRNDDDEFVATDSCDVVVGAGVAETQADLVQHPVAFTVTLGVVHALEAVGVHEEDCTRLLILLRVRDLEPMIDFYCRVIGCSVEWRRPDLGLVHLRAGRALIDLVPVDGPLGKIGGAAPGTESHNMDHFCLQVAEFDAAAHEAKLTRAF